MSAQGRAAAGRTVDRHTESSDTGIARNCSTPLERRDSGSALERLGEVTLIDEAAFERDFGNRKGSRAEHPSRAQDPSCKKPVIGRLTNRVPEGAYKIAWRETASRRDVGDQDCACKAGLHNRFCGPHLPWRKLRAFVMP